MICLKVHSGISARNFLSVAGRIIVAFISGWLLTSCAASNKLHHSSLSKIKAGKFTNTEIACKSLLPLSDYPRIESPGMTPDKKSKNRSLAVNNLFLSLRLKQNPTAGETVSDLSGQKTYIILPRILIPVSYSPDLPYLYTADEPLPLSAIPEIFEFAVYSGDPSVAVSPKHQTSGFNAIIEPVAETPTVITTDSAENLPVKRNGALLYLSAFASGMFLFWTYRKFGGRAVRIKLWAARNPWKTRFLIGGIHILLGSAGYYAGKYMASNEIQLSDASIAILLATFLTASVSYPVQKAAATFGFRKTATDLIMLLSALMIMVNAGNHNLDLKPSMFGIANTEFNINRSMDNHSPAASKSGQDVSSIYLKQGEYLFSVINSTSRIKQDLTDKKQENREKAKRIIASILAVILCLGLGFGLLMLCCGIWCNGMEFLAILLGVAGGALIILILYKLLKRINSPKSETEVITFNA